jgi:hypothetical protein
MTSRLAWGKRVSPLFREKVIRRAPEIGADPSDLMSVIAFESGRTFSPSKRNPLSTATGLIQFMAATAVELGTTTDRLAEMTAEEQLDYVFRYFTHNGYAGRIGTLGDLYMAVLWPRAIGKPDDFVLFDSVEQAKAYAANRGVDVNKDGRVTKAEATSFVARLLEEGLRPDNVWEDAEAPEVVDSPAPIEERPAPPPDERGKPMAPLLMGLASMLFSAFSPALQALITGKLGKLTGDNAASGQVATSVTTQVGAWLTDAAKKATGETDELQAVAKVVADAKANGGEGALATAVVEDVASRLDAIMPAVREVEKLEASIFADNEASRNAASERAKTDTVDLGWPIAVYVLVGFGLIAVALVILLGVQIYYDPEHRPDGTILANLGIVIGVVVSKFNTIVDYRFGSSRGSAAKDVLINELQRDAVNPAAAINARTVRQSSTSTTTSVATK